MKTSASYRQQGIALVLVLAFLVLITVFVVGFFSSATGELRASSSYAASATTRQLADSATNIVMGQIRAGTTRHAKGTVPGTENYKIYFDSWASQPGMIRSFPGGPAVPDNSANGPASALYKLYSSDHMIVEDAPGTFRGSSDIPPGWQNQPAYYTDINEPVSTVVPPTATGGTSASATSSATTAVLRYPVFDPRLFTPYPSEAEANRSLFVPSTSSDPNIPAVLEGAKVVTDATLTGSFVNQQNSRMPVRWLYSLKDGSVVAPQSISNDGKTVTFGGSGIFPTTDNPVVGRIAFWTDDDSCKLNINTAGGYTTTGVAKAQTANYAGSFWDTPRLSTLFDIGSVDPHVPDRIVDGLSASQPAAGEFQRYPGHPATTSLGLVFNSLSSEQLYSLVPRLAGGGSLGGTVQTKSESDVALTPKFDRLYSSVDELLYLFESPSSSASKLAPTQRPRVPSAVAPGGVVSKQVTPAAIDLYRFFLTAHSRSPELNLYGRPRVTLWPVWPIFGAASGVKYPHLEYAQNSYLNTPKTYSRDDFRALSTTQDKLIAFCSLVGTNFDATDARPYIFQRYDPYSSANDAQMQRNRDLLTYLQKLTDTPVPGFGGTIHGRFPDPDRDQVLAEMFDYIRCVNLQDSTHDPKPQFPPGGPPVYPPAQNTFKYAPHGVVVPSVLGKDFSYSPGFGRFPLISEVSMDFYHAGYLLYDPGTDPKTGKQLRPAVATWYYDRQQAQKYIAAEDEAKIAKKPYFDKKITGKMIASFLMLETFNPMQGFSTVSRFDPLYEVGSKGRHMYIMHRVQGLDKFKIKTPSIGFTSLQMPADATNAFFYTSGDTWGGRNVGGAEGFVHPFLANQLDAPNGETPIKVMNSATASNTTWKSWYPFQATPQGTAGFPPSPNLSDLVIPSGSGVDPITHKPRAGGPPNGVLVRRTDTSFSFQGGKLEIDVLWGQAPNQPVYSYVANFPNSTADWPIPTDNIWYGGYREGAVHPNTVASDSTSTYDSGGFYQGDETTPNSSTDLDLGAKSTSPGLPYGWRRAGYTGGDKIIRPDLQFYFWKRVYWSQSGSYNPTDIKNNGDGLYYNRRWRQILQPGDTIRSLLPQIANKTKSSSTSTNGAGKGDGDMRVMALLGAISNRDSGDKDHYFLPHPKYFDGGATRHAETLRAADGTPYIYRDDPGPNIANPNPGTSFALEDDHFQNPAAAAGSYFFPSSNPKDYPKFGKMVQNVTYTQATSATLPPGINGVTMSNGGAGDFDCGTGRLPDGAYAGKVDEGAYAWKFWDNNNKIYYYGSPYYPPNATSQASFSSHFSPNRQISSAVSFGSLLAGRTSHWQTLAFSPNAASAIHPGVISNLKDHVLLDLFTMPVVEPYAISEPFSTAGKVNLNYPIEPFGYIKRSTALRSALQSLRVTAIPAQQAGFYKSSTGVSTNYRYQVNRDLTVGIMDKFFGGTSLGSGGTVGTADNIFRSASQICEVHLVPQSPVPAIPVSTPDKISTSIMRDWWKGATLTADNMREKPYADLYPRITTKSNTFTVYMRVQVLRKVPLVGNASAVAQANLQWVEGKDQIISEYRGSSTIERYLDPADPRINGINPDTKPDGMNPDKHSLEPAYKFRVIESKRFRP